MFVFHIGLFWNRVLHLLLLAKTWLQQVDTGQVVGSYSSSMKMRRCARSFSHTCICICNCVGNFYLSARGAGGRKRRCARSFSRTRLLRDSLISTDFRVSSGNYCCSTWYNIYSEEATHSETVSCHLGPLPRRGKYIDPKYIIHPASWRENQK